jgi:hypothetical protein
MFEHKVAEIAKEDQQLVDFIELYARFKVDAAKCPDEPKERWRMRQFEAKIDAAWRKLSEDKRAVLVEALLIKKLLPEEVKKAMQVFSGRVVRVA